MTDVGTAWLIGALLAMVCLASKIEAAADGELRVLSKGRGKLLYDYLVHEAQPQFDARRKAVERALKSPEAMRARQEQLRKAYRTIFGPLPERTPLNPRVTGTIDCDGYRIENVVYESRPKHRVTATLYVPTTGTPPYPAVAVACGHAAPAKAYGLYQSVGILMAKNGLVALVYDPIGQGERHQLPKAPGHVGTEHLLLNIGALLVGECVAKYEAWDGIRGIDYLLSRPEVDRTKPVGMTGNSGGGSQTKFLMALDERIFAAAPSCHMMTYERKIVTRGPAAGCQHMPGEGAHGFEQTDFVTLRAPKPTILLAAEQDYFDIRSTRQLFREAQAVYRVLGHPERVDFFSWDDKHSFSKPRRQKAVEWMRRWLLGDPSPVVEPKLHLQPDRALWATRKGQVWKEYRDEVSVAALNLRRARELASARKHFWASHDKAACLAEVRRLIGLRDARGKPTVEAKGILERDGCRLQKLVLRRPGEMPVPALLFLPAAGRARRPATLYVDGRGKAADAQPGGAIEQLVAEGRIVLSVDASGFGETADSVERLKPFYNLERRVAMLAMHIGRPLLGQRVGDALAALDVLAARDDVDADHIDLVGVERGGPVALHAAALDERVTALTLRHSIRSWIDDVVARPTEPNLIGHVVPHALERYDLPDLLAAIAPRPVRFAAD